MDRTKSRMARVAGGLVAGPSMTRETEAGKRGLAGRKEGSMRKRIVPFAVALLLLVVAGCASSDPTTSDEYAALEQELVQSEAQLAEVVAERDVLAAEAEAAAAVLQEADAAGVPDDVAALTDAWGDAINAGEGAVAELYTMGGHHRYEDQRLASDELAAHLEASGKGVWVSDPYLLVDEGDGRYVVARGAHAGGTYPGSLTFVIVTTSDGELEIAETAFVYAGSQA